MELQLKIIGVLLILLALIHAFFPKYFAWNRELSGLSLINRQMMYVHTFFIAFAVLLMGLMCLTSSAEITRTPLGRKVSFGLALFWAPGCSSSFSAIRRNSGRESRSKRRCTSRSQFSGPT